MSWDTLTFDCYGTLIDWEGGIVDAFRREAGRDGVELDAAAILDTYMEIEPEVEAGPYRAYREVLAETASRVGGRLGWEIGPERGEFLPASLPDWPVFPDTRPALERLARRFDLAILSNVDDDLLQATVDRLGMDFAWTVTAERVRRYKPAPDHFLRALDRVGGNRERLLHVAGSLYHDVAPASAVGLAVVWVNRKGEVAPAHPVPDRIVEDLEELADGLEP